MVLFFFTVENTLAVASLGGASDRASTSVGAIVGAVIGGVLAGGVLTAAAIYYAMKRRQPKIPSSPHYLSAKQQNHYVSMGSLDWKKGSVVDNCSVLLPLKQMPAGGGGGGGGGGGKISNQVSDYPTATIKRTSNLNSRELRANIEADNIF